MKKTIATINNQIFWHRVNMLWCYIYSAFLTAYGFFIFFSPFAIGICIERMGATMALFFGWIKWLCCPIFLYHLFYALDKLLEENGFFAEESKKNSSKMNKLQDVIYNKKRLKILLRNSSSNKLDYYECDELYNIFVKLEINEGEFGDILAIYGSDEAIRKYIFESHNFNKVTNSETSTEKSKENNYTETLSMWNLINFENIEDGLTTFWVSGKEMYWYQKAWSILEECGLTSYDDDLEYCEVYLRAIALSMIYSDFCKLAFDEYDYYDCYEEKYENKIEDITLGALYSKLEDVEHTTDKHIVVCELADSKRKEVFSALCKKLDEFEIFMGMYFTSFEPYEVSFDTYEGYWDIILNHSTLLKDDIISEDSLTLEGQQAYDWIAFDGASRVQDIE